MLIKVQILIRIQIGQQPRNEFPHCSDSLLTSNVRNKSIERIKVGVCG